MNRYYDRGIIKASYKNGPRLDMQEGNLMHVKLDDKYIELGYAVHVDSELDFKAPDELHSFTYQINNLNGDKLNQIIGYPTLYLVNDNVIIASEGKPFMRVYTYKIQEGVQIND